MGVARDEQSIRPAGKRDQIVVFRVRRQPRGIVGIVDARRLFTKPPDIARDLLRRPVSTEFRAQEHILQFAKESL